MTKKTCFFATPIMETEASYAGQQELLIGYIEEVFAHLEDDWQVKHVVWEENETEVLAQIHDNLQQSELCIVDLSPRDPNLYYQLGYAVAKKTQVIRLRKQALTSETFDVAMPDVYYELTSETGLAQFKTDLAQAVAGEKPADNPLAEHAKKDIGLSVRINDEGVVEP